MKSQASDNDIIETITTIKSDFSDESPAKKYNKAPVAFQK